MIHASSVIESGAEIAPDAEVGPFCYVGPNVKIGSGCRLIHGVTILGRTRLGAKNIFHPYCVIGGDPQDFKYQGEDSETWIGDENTFRECVTVNKGTEIAGNKTVIGNKNYFMASSHVAHDSIIEDECLLVNQCLLAGHVKVETGAILSAFVGLHHFVTVGRYAFVGGATRVVQDVPPFMIVQGPTGEVRGVNSIGLRRRGFASGTINALREAHRILWRSGLPKPEALQQLEAKDDGVPEVRKLIEFVRASDQGRMGRALEETRPAPLVREKRG